MILYSSMVEVIDFVASLRPSTGPSLRAR